MGTDASYQAGIGKGSGIILSGGLVAFPTESFYGLAVDALNEKAVKRLFLIKKRPPDQPILILLPSIEKLDSYVSRISKVALLLIGKFWPGGLTLVFEAGLQIPALLTGGSGKIGIRLSSHRVAADLAGRAGIAITGTSANVSGTPPCVTADEVQQALGKEVDFILDGGETEGGKGSTVLDVTVTPPQIIREGMISHEQIKAVL